MSTKIGFRLLRVGQCSHPECIAQRGGRFAAVPFPALTGLLIHPQRGPMLFDTGYSNAFFAATERFPERLYRLVTPVSLNPDESLAAQLACHGFTPGDVKHLFVSHLHADHIAGIGDYEQARIFVMRAEVEAMRRASRIGGLRRGYLRTLLPDRFDSKLSYVDDCSRIPLPDSMQPFSHGFDLLGDRSVIGVSLPGHTAGQLGLLFETTEARTVFLVADACWSLEALRHDRPPTWIASQLFADKREYLSTFAALRQILARQENLLMVPSHCESTWKRLSHEPR